MRRSSTILWSTSAMAFALCASPAFAQDQTQPAAPPDPTMQAQTNPADPDQGAPQTDDAVQTATGQDQATSEGEAIVVTGLRRSLQSAQNIKRNSQQQIDAIVAEDIGKLPDVNTAETAARIPGLQVIRRGGEADTVLIRGLPDFATTYNGREIFTAETRVVALQDFPSSNIAALEVFKTTTGHNAVIVLADADLDKAAKGSVVAAFGTTGQRCTAARRILADRSVVEPLTAKLTELTRELKVGPGTKQGTDIGPLVEEKALTAVLEQIEIARNEGARILSGGKRLRGELADGYFMEPTLLDNVSPQMKIAREEVFGPVLPIMPVSGYDEAIEVATGTDYGLTSSIFTRDINTAFRFMHDTDTGVVHINKPPIGGESHLPFGGLKHSALGPKEMGAATEFFTQTKTVYVDWAE
jgi:hypothetical protein